MVIDIKEIAELLNITPKSTGVYIELLTHGELSQKQLQTLLDFSEKEIQKPIQNLLDKGLILSVENSEGITLFQTMSLLQLEEKIDREKMMVNNLKKFLIPEFGSLNNLGIVKYNGLEGIRKVLLEVLEEAKITGENILAYENGMDAETIGPLFMNNYIKKRVDNKLEAYVITPNTIKDREYKENHEGHYTHIKILDDFAIESNINIVGDLVMTFTLNPAQGTLTRNKAKAQTWKAIFWKLWNS